MTERRKAKFLEVLKRRQADLTIVIEDIHDPHNVSAMLRSADAVGILEVQLVYTVDKFPRLGKKSSASAVKWVKQRRFRSIAECYERLHDEGYCIVATHLGAKSKSLYELDLKRPTALVFGNEHRGVSPEAARLADGNFQIPMSGMIQSLNVSVACAVALYEAFRQRAGGRPFAPSSLSEHQLNELYQEWMKK